MCACKEEALKSAHATQRRSDALDCRSLAGANSHACFGNILPPRCASLLRLPSLVSEVILEKIKLKSQNLGLLKIKARSLYILRVIKNISLPNSKFFGRKCNSHCDSVVTFGHLVPPSLLPGPSRKRDARGCCPLVHLFRECSLSVPRGLSLALFYFNERGKRFKIPKRTAILILTQTDIIVGG